MLGFQFELGVGEGEVGVGEDVFPYFCVGESAELLEDPFVDGGHGSLGLGRQPVDQIPHRPALLAFVEEVPLSLLETPNVEEVLVEDDGGGRLLQDFLVAKVLLLVPVEIALDHEEGLLVDAGDEGLALGPFFRLGHPVVGDLIAHLDVFAFDPFLEDGEEVRLSGGLLLPLLLFLVDHLMGVVHALPVQ